MKKETITWLLRGPIIRKFFFLLSRKKKLNVLALEYVFSGKYGLRIGGGLRDEFKGLSEKAGKILDINIITNHHSQNTKTDAIMDASDLKNLESRSFDFVCSSHVLEHISNPIKALCEWNRVLKQEGYLYIGIPYYRYTFDFRRKATSLSHLLADYINDTSIHDKTHLEDYISKWEIRMDTIHNSYKDFISAVSRNGVGTIHHHVFSKKNIKKLLSYYGFSIIFCKIKGRTIHLLAKNADQIVM